MLELRRQTIRRSVIVAIVAVLILGTGALLFSNSKGSSTTTTSSTTIASTTTTTIALTAAEKAAQVAANNKAVAAGCPASTTTRVNTLTWSKAPAMTINTSLTYYAHVNTTAGNFVIKLDAATAPITTNNFVFLAEHKFYNCVIFHRVIPNFVIQGGDPTGTGSGGPGDTIADEYPKTASPQYPLYSVAMANEGSAHTGGSQFFIVTGSAGEQLGPTYSLFGEVVSGKSVVKAINAFGSASGVPPNVTERMLTVTISQS